jgi:hypothetical protein
MVDQIDYFSFNITQFIDATNAPYEVRAGGLTFNFLKIERPVDGDSPTMLLYAGMGTIWQVTIASIAENANPIIPKMIYIFATATLSSLAHYVNDEGVLMERMKIRYEQLEMMAPYISNGVVGGSDAQFWDVDKQSRDCPQSDCVLDRVYKSPRG